MFEHTATGPPRDELGVRLDDLTAIQVQHSVLMTASLDDFDAVEFAVVPVRRSAHENGSDTILFAGFFQDTFEHLAQAIGPFLVAIAIAFADISWLGDAVGMCATASAHNLIRRVLVGRVWQVQTQPATRAGLLVGPHQERKFRHSLGPHENPLVAFERELDDFHVFRVLCDSEGRLNRDRVLIHCVFLLWVELSLVRKSIIRLANASSQLESFFQTQLILFKDLTL